MEKTADVVVIGAGVNGCSIAYHLAKRGIKKVILLEKRYTASGPTGRSSGIVRQHYTIEVLAKMALYSLQVFQRFGEEIGGSAGFVRTGYLCVASEENAATLKKTVEMHQRVGIKTSVLSPDELRKLEPLMYCDDLACGAYEPDSGYADPALTANSFCAAARELGVELLPRTPVTGLKLEHGQVTAVRTNQGEISTGTAINVAGPWGGRIAALAGVQIPIRPSRHPVVLLRRPPQWRNPIPVVNDFVNAAYLKPEGQSNSLVGSLSPEEANEQANPDSYAEIPDYQTTLEFSEKIMKRFPVMSEARVQGGWAGIYDVTPDWAPVIDQISEVEGLYCAVGFSGHGFKLSPAVGRMMSELVVDGKCTGFDISPFRLSRFQEGQLTRGKYAYSIIG
ncbi:MAG: NAD(P)/FAD-dependent oxidoreductase [Terriglobia bacterium]